MKHVVYNSKNKNKKVFFVCPSCRLGVDQTQQQAEQPEKEISTSLLFLD